MRPCATALCVVVAALATRSAIGAQPGSGRVSMQVVARPGTEQCIDQVALQHAVEARLQRAVFTDDARPPLVIHLSLDRNAGREWLAKLTLLDDSGRSLGERELATRAAHCSALDDSLALVVALLVDAPLEEQLRKEAAQREAPAPVAPVNTPPLSLRIPTQTHAPREPWRVNGRAAATLSLGSLPAAAPGFELGLGLRPPLGLALQVFTGFAAARSTAGDAGARVSLWYGGLEVRALELELGSVLCSLWLGETVGALRAEAFGFDENSSSTRAYLAPFARGRVVQPVSSQLGLLLEARAEVPLTRASFVVESSDGGERSLFQSPGVSGMLGVGLIVGPR